MKIQVTLTANPSAWEDAPEQAITQAIERASEEIAKVAEDNWPWARIEFGRDPKATDDAVMMPNADQQTLESVSGTILALIEARWQDWLWPAPDRSKIS